MRNKFSIVITTYNRAKLLSRAVNSLLAQTEASWEAWIIDDGSVDETRELVKFYLNKGAPIEYIYQDNQGEAAAKNRGIILSRGEYISFLDSDDEYKISHLSSRQKILADHPEVDLLHGGVTIVGNPFVPDIQQPENKIHIGNCVVGATFFFRRESLVTLGGFNALPLGSDVDLFSRAKKLGYKILKTEEPTYIYHRTNYDSITHKFWESKGK